MPLFLFFNELFFCLFVKIKIRGKLLIKMKMKMKMSGAERGGDEKKN